MTQKQKLRLHLKTGKKAGKKNGEMLMAIFATVLLTLALLMVPARAFAKLTVTISTTPSLGGAGHNTVRVRPGTPFTYTISVSSDKSTSFPRPKHPDFTGFDNEGESTQSSTSVNFTNGALQSSQTTSYSYQLVPEKGGTYTLGPATVAAGGKLYKSQSIIVKVSRHAPQVTSGSAGSNQLNLFGNGPSAADLFSKLLQEQMGGFFRPTPGLPSAKSSHLYFIQAVVNRHKAYVGQQVTVTYYLVTRAQIADIDTLRYPNLTGFWKEDIDIATELNFNPVSFNGVTYQRALLASYALFPLHAGVIKIDSYQTKCKVVVANNMGLPETENVVRESGEIPIEVKPLPTTGKPAHFSGGVGQFVATDSVDNTSTQVGQPVTLTMRIQGKGNAKLADMPKLHLGTQAQIFDSKKTMKFDPDGHSFKQDQVLIVPQKAGTLKIPPFDFWFFNPHTKRYYDSKTSAIAIQVAPGSGNTPYATPAPVLANIGGSGSVAVTNKNVMPGLLLTPEPSGPIAHLSSVQIAGLWGTLWGMSALVLGVLAWQQLRETDSREDLSQKIDRRLKVIQAAANGGQYRDVGRVATETIHQVLGEIAGLGGASYEFERMAEHAPPSFKRELVPPLRSLLSRLEALAYAPEAMVEPLREKAELKKLVSEAHRLLHLAAQYDFTSKRNATRPSDPRT